MNTGDMNAEHEIYNRMNHIFEKTPDPGALNIKPPLAFIRRKQGRLIFRLIMVSLATIAIVTTSVLAFTGYIPFIPGVVSTAKITHSIEKEIIFKQGSSGHRIMYGYIKDSQVYLKILYYDTAIGLTGNQSVKQEEMSLSHKRQEYGVIYNGIACKDYHKSYSNTSADLQFKLPQVLQDERMVFELYGDEQKIGDIVMMPTSQSIEFNKERPHATLGDITLVADITQDNDVLDIYISAVLPNPVDYYDIVDEHLNGYAESEVYLTDKAGNKITNLGERFYSTSMDITNGEYDDDAMLMFYHHYRFALNELKDDEYTLVVPSVTYLDNKESLFRAEKKIEVKGPFEMIIYI